jgi:hypothetical protein
VLICCSFTGRLVGAVSNLVLSRTHRGPILFRP